jgi:predicted outer membrane repeat protein
MSLFRCARTFSPHPVRDLAAVIALGSTAFAPDVAVAVDRLVPDEYSTIQSAILAASPGDEVKVSNALSPYVEQLALVDGVTVRGGFRPDFLIQDPEAFETVIQRPPGVGTVVGASDVGSSVLFEGFTVTGGDSTFSGAGMFVGSNTSFTIRFCTFRGNRADVTGGGMQIAAGSSVIVTECLFEENYAGSRGGGITVAAGSDGVLIERCTIRACSTGTTGGQGGAGMFTASGIRLERNKFRENFSGLSGGALYVNNASIRAWGNLITDNVANANGGGIFHEGGSSEHNATLVEGCQSGADGIGNGGAIYFNGGSNRFLKGFIRGNSAPAGAGLGGGMYFDQTMHSLVKDTEIVQNTANHGGGVYVEGPPSGTWSFSDIESCTIMGNAADGVGAAGGVHVVGQELGVILNCIIALQADGHGISCVNPASPNIRFNDVFNQVAQNPDSEYGLDCPDRTGINGNIRTNPMYCDPTGTPPDLALQSSSPCLVSGEGGTHMGAHGASEACGTISIEPSSWGKIKSLYR